MAADYERVAAEALRKNPHDANAWNEWGRGLFDEAKRSPTDAVVPLLRDAERKFAVAADLKPSVPQYWRNWGVTLYQLAIRSTGQDAIDLLEKAGAKFETYLQRQPRDHSIWHDWGCALLKRAQFTQGNSALPLFEESYIRFAVATDMARNEAYWQNWGVALQAHGRRLHNTASVAYFYIAAEKFATVVRLAPERHSSWNDWGVSLSDIGSRDDLTSAYWIRLGLEKIDAAVERGPDVGSYRINRAMSYTALARKTARRERLELFAMADAEYAAAIERNLPQRLAATAHALRGDALVECAIYSNGDKEVELFNKALDYYQNAIDLDPDNYVYWHGRGYTLMTYASSVSEEYAEELTDEAITTYVHANSINPADGVVLSNWAAIIIMQAKRYDGVEAEHLLVDAEAKCIEAIRIAPTKHEPWINWGSVLHLRAKRISPGEERDHLLSDALAKYAEADRLKPGATTYNRASIAALSGDPDRCRELLEIALAEDTLPKRREIDSETDFDAIRGESWFVDLLERDRAAGDPTGVSEQES